MKRLINLILIAVIVSISVNAIGITPVKMEFNFVPGEVHNFSVKIDSQREGNTTYSVSFEGELGKYLSTSDKINKITIEGSSKTVYIVLSLPESLEKAGQRTAAVTISETSPDPGAVAVLTAIKIPISVWVPYPGRYLEISLDAKDIEEKERPIFKVAANNMGKENLKNVVANIEVYSNDLLFESISSNTESMGSQSRSDMFIRSKKAYSAGEYAVIASVSYDGLATPKEKATLRVGALFVNITDHTTEIEKGKVNKFAIKLKSLWNEPISSIAAELKLLDLNNNIKDEVKTSSIDLKPWQDDQITTFLDATNLSLGSYNVEAKLLYEGISRTEILPVVVKEKVLEEQPAQEKFDRYKYILVGSIVLGILIVLMDVIFVVYFRKKQHKELKEFKQELDRNI